MREQHALCDCLTRPYVFHNDAAEAVRDEHDRVLI
jgi:hypothetical protein